jgi:putative solute:sodium symporter small subunit
MSASPTEPPPDAAQRYWRYNLKLVGILLTIWFLVSYGAGILFVDTLDEVRFFGFPLGFWFAQQGAIYVFVILIFVYSRLMNRAEKRLGLSEDGE